MRRVIAILLLLSFGGLASGALGRLHDFHHEHEDALAEQSGGGEQDHAPVHDENNCPIHALLRAPLISSTWLVAVLPLGETLSPARESSFQFIPQRIPTRLDCRGPPRA